MILRHDTEAGVGLLTIDGSREELLYLAQNLIKQCVEEEDDFVRFQKTRPRAHAYLRVGDEDDDTKWFGVKRVPKD